MTIESRDTRIDSSADHLTGDTTQRLFSDAYRESFGQSGCNRPGPGDREMLREFSELIYKTGGKDFGSGETRDAFAQMFQDARDQGKLDRLLADINRMSIGRGAIKFSYDDETKNLNMIHSTPLPADGGFSNPIIVDKLKLH